MTEEEFNRYQKAVEIKDKINNITRELNYIKSNFEEVSYPRCESEWGIRINLNNSYKTIVLSSELFWECVDFIKKKKQEELDNYKKEFDKL